MRVMRTMRAKRNRVAMATVSVKAMQLTWFQHVLDRYCWIAKMPSPPHRQIQASIAQRAMLKAVNSLQVAFSFSSFHPLAPVRPGMGGRVQPYRIPFLWRHSDGT